MTITKLKNVNISGFKLVVASVGTGNVAQLAADLFIESLSMEKFAFVSKFVDFFSLCFMPGFRFAIPPSFQYLDQQLLRPKPEMSRQLPRYSSARSTSC